MSPAEVQIVMAVVRQTIGWQREEASLTVSEFKTLTKMARASVVAGIRDALKRGMISRKEDGKSFIYRVADPDSPGTSVQFLNRSENEPVENFKDGQDESVQKLDRDGSKFEPMAVPELQRIGSKNELSTVQKVDRSSVQNLNPIKRNRNTKKKEKKEGERAPSMPVRIHARNGSHREMVYKSPHVNKNHFDRATGFVRPGSGTTAVEIYYERFDICSDEHRLNAILEDDLVRHCRDLGLLREVITAYHQAGHRPRNIKLILDWYREPIRFRKEPHGTNFGRNPGTYEPPLAADFTQREWDDWRATIGSQDADIPY